MTKQLIILQVCRRFGPVGGMERYAWEVTRELAAMGHEMHVLCEVDLCTEPLSGVHIHALGTVRPKPRWLAHIRFSRRVHAWLEQYKTPEMIIHSHERTQDHHITTFHGPPFAKVRDLPLWKRFSLRIKMNLWLEQRELCANQVQMIVPNSIQISEELEDYYPAIINRITPPIVPGVTTGIQRPVRAIQSDAGVIGFVGKEWKRKGLAMAIHILTKLAETRPNLNFMVAGPTQNDIRQLFKSTPFNISLLGEVDTKDLYAQFDVLLHPASNEPYGMVITEALSSGVPVVISDLCGAKSEVSAERGHVLSLTDDTIETWSKAVDACLSRTDSHIHYQRSWHDTAMAYVQLYQKIKHL